MAGDEKRLGEVSWSGAVLGKQRLGGVLRDVDATGWSLVLGPVRWKRVLEKAAMLPAGTVSGSPGCGPE
jgi:hypothetical protein